MSLVIKLKTPNSASIPAFFDARPSWEDLVLEINSLFRINKKNVGVTFIDEAMNPILLKNEQDLQQFYTKYPGDIKFFVHDLQAPAQITPRRSADPNLSNLANDQLKLFCWVHDVFGNPFPVVIGKGATVGDLKKKIKKKKDILLGTIDPDTLELWKLSLPIASAEIRTKLEHVQSPQEIPGCAKLDSGDELSEHFSSAPRKHVHIIVEVPPPPTLKRKHDDIPDHMREIYERFWDCGEDIFHQRTSVKIPDPSSVEVDDNSEVLNLAVIKIPSYFGCPELLVVEIYETFWGLLESEDQEWQNMNSSNNPDGDPFLSIYHSTMITGQPGIGKSLFLAYVLVRRLANGRTTIYCDKRESAYIFDNKGVRSLTFPREEDRIWELDNDLKCCALVNLGEHLVSAPTVFYPTFIRKGRVVMAAPPSEKHWAGFLKELPAMTYIMPTWKWGPLYMASLLAAKKTNLNAVDVEHCKKLQKNNSIFRGIPRLCFRSLNDHGFRFNQSRIDDALDDIKSFDQFVLSMKGRLPFDSHITHRLIRVEPDDAGLFKMRRELMSHNIAERVFKRFLKITQARVSEHLLNYLANPDTRTVAGVLFEHAAHFSIRKGLKLSMTPLSSSRPLEINVPPAENQKSRYYSLNIRSGPRSQSVHSDFRNLYMTPVLKDEPSIDALFVASAPNLNATFLFQMTVSDHHPINFQGLNKVFENLPAGAQKQIYFVFVIPAFGRSGEEFQGIQSRQSIDTPQNADPDKVERFEGIPQYVCKLDISALRWT